MRRQPGHGETGRLGDRESDTRLFSLSPCRLVCLLSVCFLLLNACSLPGTASGPPPTPTPPLLPYDNAIATADAGGDARGRAQAFYERANVLLDQGAHQRAIADYDRAIALDPTNARAFNNRGLAHAALGLADQALADYAQAVRLDPTYVRAYRNRLNLLEQRGDLKGMAANYLRLAEVDQPNRADHLYHAGVALRGLGDRAGARKQFDAALAADPQHVDALYERALLRFAQGDRTGAIADFDAALRLSPRAANAYYARGLARAALGDNNAAIGDFDAALKLKADYAEALLGRAAAYHGAGKDAQARADLDRLATLSPDEALSAAADALRRQLLQA
jgi:tetratricopeptide (TPR) repeat protein